VVLGVLGLDVSVTRASFATSATPLG